MENSLIKFVVPDGKIAIDPAYAFADPNDNSISAGIGASYGIIGYKGKTWSLRLRGQTHYFTRPDDGTANPVINGIILAVAPTKSKSYFAKWEEGSDEPPVCWSMDSITPDYDVPPSTSDGKGKQSDTCTLCPRNVWYPNPETGGKKRDCNDYKRVALLLDPNVTKRMLGAPLEEAVFLRVPAASLENFGALGDQLLKCGIPFLGVVTRIEFDKEKAFPKMVFTAVSPAPANLAKLVQSLYNDPTTTGRIIGTTLSNRALLAPAAPAAPAAPPSGRQQPPPTIDQQSTGTTQAAPATTHVAQAPALPMPVSQNAPAIAIAIVEGFGEEEATQGTAATLAVAAADTGPPTAAQDDLDARIAALMPK